MKISNYKFFIMFLYCIFIVPLALFIMLLFFQWVGAWIASGRDGYTIFSMNNVIVALKISLYGFPLGIIWWLSYYIPYRKNNK